jgi:rod shape-determining protein MreC
MQQIINFVIRNKTFLLFFLLFGVSLALTIQSHSYHKSKFINSANFFTGGVYKQVNNIGQYFDLKSENQKLLEENNRLKSILFNRETDTLKSFYADSTMYSKRFKLTPAVVYKNSYSATNNYLTINKGKKDGIQQDFGVITSKGIIGIIDNTSNSYARVQSILNTNSRINAQLKKTSHIGSLRWDTKSPELAQLKDVSKFAPVAKGDTIVTGGQSTIFPKGIPIGTVNDFVLDIGGDTYTINVKLFNDMTNVGHVYIIEHLDREEIETLQNPVNE